MKSCKNYYLLLCLFVLSVSVDAEAHVYKHQKQKFVTKSGIQWINGLSWSQVKEKAKLERKYIFLDLYATWCGPCKEMDKYVYPNDTVGALFNERFISVKVQTDQTKNDNEEIRKWYADAQVISKKYHIMSLPSFLFLTPNGELAHIATGFHNVQKFIKEAEIAIKPGQIYHDPYQEFDQLEANYKEGNTDYGRMLYMIRCARELGKEEFEKQLTQDYYNYLEKTTPEQLYTKENMSFLNEVELKSDSRLFIIFYPNGKRADDAFGKKGFSERIVHRIVLREIVNPFLEVKEIGPKPISLDGKAIGLIDSSEADWKLLHRKILSKYPEEYAKKGVLNAKLIWYEQKENFREYYNTYLEKLDLYGFDTISNTSNATYSKVNFNCWFLFLRISDMGLLQKGAQLMEKLIQKLPYDPTYIDTYANLLYKVGKKEQAIFWEEKALELAKKFKYQRNVELYTEVLSKMRKNINTW